MLKKKSKKNFDWNQEDKLLEQLRDIVFFVFLLAAAFLFNYIYIYIGGRKAALRVLVFLYCQVLWWEYSMLVASHN